VIDDPSICQSVCHLGRLCKHGWRPARGVCSWGPKKHCIRRRSPSPRQGYRGFDVAFAKLLWPLVITSKCSPQRVWLSNKNVKETTRILSACSQWPSKQMSHIIIDAITCPQLFPRVWQSNAALLLVTENSMSDTEAFPTPHKHTHTHAHYRQLLYTLSINILHMHVFGQITLLVSSQGKLCLTLMQGQTINFSIIRTHGDT